MLAIVVGIAQFSLLLWTQFGLQHGAEMAARCASIDATTCASVDSIQSYAVTQAYGLSLPPTTFTVGTAGDYMLKIPADPGVVVPGYYMLFALNTKGVPSVSRTLRVR